MTEPVVVATVVAHDNQAGVGFVLRRLNEQTRRPDGVVVIDNGSHPALRPIGDLAGEELPTEWRRQVMNGGVGAGHNAAIEAAIARFRPDVIWLLEHDTFPDDDCLAELLRCRAGHDRPVILQSSITRNNYERRWLPDPTAPPSRASKLTLNGIVMDVDVVSTLGRFREDFFVGHEDDDFARRANAAGIAIWNCPAAVVVHANKGNGRFAAESSPSRLYYSIRNATVLDDPGFVGRTFVACRGGLAGAIELVRPGRGLQFARARWKGTADGLRGRLGPRF